MDKRLISVNFKGLWEAVISQFPLDINSIHGPRHWKQVEKNGLMLAQETGADETIIKLFSLFHDSRRENEHIDDGHGIRGAELAKSTKGIHFDLPDESFEMLIEACRNHTDGQPTSNITIATCWDADRLDLPRVGIKIDPDRMGTAPGKRLARAQQGLLKK
ncbi:conserved hypothetical protein [sediment metagenome]|uniref:Uncharacterized protein n=1 Tax=sediment metagenome TaxID=749907 RepID=D9PHW3_9ZZZZ